MKENNWEEFLKIARSHKDSGFCGGCAYVEYNLKNFLERHTEEAYDLGKYNGLEKAVDEYNKTVPEKLRERGEYYYNKGKEDLMRSKELKQVIDEAKAEERERIRKIIEGQLEKCEYCKKVDIDCKHYDHSSNQALNDLLEKLSD